MDRKPLGFFLWIKNFQKKFFITRVAHTLSRKKLKNLINYTLSGRNGDAFDHHQWTWLEKFRGLWLDFEKFHDTLKKPLLIFAQMPSQQDPLVIVYKLNFLLIRLQRSFQPRSIWLPSLRYMSPRLRWLFNFATVKFRAGSRLHRNFGLRNLVL